MSPVTYGIRMEKCPHCKTIDLLDMGYDDNERRYYKNCPVCQRWFYRCKGYGHKWQPMKGF